MRVAPCYYIGINEIHMKTLYQVIEEVDPQGLIDYLSDNPDAEVVQKLINVWETETLATGDVKKYIEKSGLHLSTVKQMMSQLNANDCSVLISVLSKHSEFEEYDTEQPISGYLVGYIKRLTEMDMSDEGINKLISDKTAPGTISVGPGENVVCLLFKDTKVAKKSDVVVSGKLTEFKFGGGRVCTTSSKMTIAQVWDGIGDKFGDFEVEWPSDGKGNDNTYNIKQTKIESAVTTWWKNLTNNINKTLYAHIPGVILANVDKMFGSKLQNDKSLEQDVYGILRKEWDNNAIGKTLIRMMGCLCVIAYKEVEGFNQLLVQSKTGGKYIKASLITDFSLNGLMNSKLVFSRPNASDSFKGMVINTL